MEMELLYTSLFLTFILLLLWFKHSVLSRRPKSAQKKLSLPPGPWQLPIIGSIHHLHGSLPHRTLRDLSRIHGPLMHLKLGEVSTIVVSSPEAAREILKTHDVTFSSRPLFTVPNIISYGGKSLIFAPYGEFWRQLRKVCVLELLSAKRVQSFQSIREEEALALVRSIASEFININNDNPAVVVVNISHLINTITNDITLRAVIGGKCKEQATFLSALTESVEEAGGFDLADLFPSSPLVGLLSGKRLRVERIHRKLDRILDGIIQEHKERRARSRASKLGEEDLLDALLRVQEEDNPDVPLTSDSLKAVILDIFGAGSETSSTTLVWTMAELVRNPLAMKKAQSEIRAAVGEKGKLTESDVNGLRYLKLVVKESMRLHIPVPLLIPRECRETCSVLGYEIPAKARVVVNAWAMGRDLRYWGEDVEEFRPERFEGSEVDFKGANFEFIPFGAGRRICPGMSFGVANIEHTLAHLLCYFDWELPDGARPEDMDMAESFGATAPMRSDLHLRAIPRIPIPCPTPTPDV